MSAHVLYSEIIEMNDPAHTRVTAELVDWRDGTRHVVVLELTIDCLIPDYNELSSYCRRTVNESAHLLNPDRPASDHIRHAINELDHVAAGAALMVQQYLVVFVPRAARTYWPELSDWVEEPEPFDLVPFDVLAEAEA